MLPSIDKLSLLGGITLLEIVFSQIQNNARKMCGCGNLPWQQFLQ